MSCTDSQINYLQLSNNDYNINYRGSKLKNNTVCRSRSFHTLKTRTETVKSTKVIAIKVINEIIPKIILQLKFDGCKGIR